jgi:hypothetical protein
LHLLLSGLACLAYTAGGATAQTTFFSIEPNDTKLQATPALGAIAGDRLYVNLFNCGWFTGPDIFRLRTAPLPPGIYRHRLVPPQLTTERYPSILGRTQFHGTIDPGSTAIVQRAVDTTNPSRFLQWYAFGQAEELYVDLDEGSGCRTFFEVALETAPVAVTPIPVQIPEGDVMRVTPTGASSTMDLDFWVFDGDFDALPGSGFRRGSSGTPGTDVIVTAGRYYLAVSQGPLVHHQEAWIGDNQHSDDVLDFRGAVTSQRADFGASFELRVGDLTNFAIVQGSFTEPWQVVWFQIDVSQGQNTGSFCPGDASAGACACGASAAGQGTGCSNSNGRGARLFAHGHLGVHSVRYALEDLPPFTTALVFAGLSTTAGSPSFAGNLCLGAGAVRIDTAQADPLGRCEIWSGSAFSNAGFFAGTTVHAQAVYRDVAAGGACFVNATNGESLTVRL